MSMSSKVGGSDGIGMLEAHATNEAVRKDIVRSKEQPKDLRSKY
jgi:hypothetical protein